MSKYKSLEVREEKGRFIKRIIEKSISDLPEHEVLINVKYSTLNFKDALSASGNKGVTRSYPHTPGIDAAGVVAKSLYPNFKEGDEVFVTGNDLGMNTSGGLAEYISVPSGWITPLPKMLSLKETMILGTAGLTAGLGVYKLMRNEQSLQGKIIVTGATGGVGCIAIAILSKLGFFVVASTNKHDMTTFLTMHGAKRIISRDEVLVDEKKPLARPVWSGGFDTLGGNYTLSILKTTQKEGSVVITGLVSSHLLNATVLPFILNGINLLGINSADCPNMLRNKIWKKLASEWKPNNIEALATTISLEEVPDKLDAMLKGESRGKTVVKI